VPDLPGIPRPSTWAINSVKSTKSPLLITDVFAYIPSWVSVGVGHMAPEKTVLKLARFYKRKHVNFVQASVTEVHPYEADQYVIATRAETQEQIWLDYDYLLITTGPKLNFEGCGSEQTLIAT